MFEVECLDPYDVPIEYYTQWDINQKMKIILRDCEEGLLTIPPNVHFANVRHKEAYVVRSSVENGDTILVNVPNVLLEENVPLLAYVYLTDRNDVSSQKTILKIDIPVRKRARPSNYDYVENIERITAQQIKREIKEELADDMYDSVLSLKGITFRDVVTGVLHKLYVSNGKLMLENLGTTDEARRLKAMQARTERGA